jgi:uncharacterized LabA/DUF88 family protein
MTNGAENDGDTLDTPPKRVYGFVDGFNLYHALEKFDPIVPAADPRRFQKYKWLCLMSLMKRFLLARSEILIGVDLFTAYPNWINSDAKRQRHEVFVSAQKSRGVEVIFGEFRTKKAICQAIPGCGKEFDSYVEKQTDINIAISMIRRAPDYDKAILLTADSDQVPTVRLLKSMYSDKRFAVMPPIGRGAKELIKECDEHFKMTEQHLIDCQLPNPLPIEKNGKVYSHLVKPTTWP